MAAKQRVSIVSAHVAASRREVGTLTPVATKEDEAMKDEYSNMSGPGALWKCPGAFELECGQALHECVVGYNTYGTLNENRDNAIVVCHALTGNSQVDGWWGGLIGDGKAVDTKKYYVICANVLASCYGTCGPATIDPQTGEEYGPSFPAVTIRDSVKLHRRLVFEHLQVRSLALVFGGSMGGMQVLEWLCLSERLPTGEMDVRRGLPIACGAAHTSWQIGISETQRNAIFADPRWNGGSYEKSNPPTTGLMIARQIAMITYRTSSAYMVKFSRDDGGHMYHRGLGLPKFPRLPSDDGSKWKVQTYLEHQGEKFRGRFDPLCYVRLTALMDSMDIGRGRGGVEKAMAAIKVPVAIVAISSDVLYPVHEQQELVRHIPNSEFWMVDSLEGHDAFILETEQIGKVCSRMLDSKEWVPRRNVTTYCTSFTSNDERTQEEQKFHETEAAQHRTLADFHEKQKTKPKQIPAFWL